MPIELQHLLNMIACLHSSVDYLTLKIIFTLAYLDEALKDIEERGLLQVSRAQSTDDQIPQLTTFDLHPIVRRYAYDRLTSADRATTHTRLVNYFATIPKRETIEKLDDLNAVIEMYHQLVMAEKFDEAYQMYCERLHMPLYYKFGAYELNSKLLFAISRTGNGIPNLSYSRDQIGNLYYATLCCERTGRLEVGLRLIQKTINLARMTNEEASLGSAQGTFAIISCDYGNLEIANTSIIESVKIFDNMGDSNWRGISHRGYAKILASCGIFDNAEKELEIAESAYNHESRFRHGLSVISIFRGQLHFWQRKYQKALEYAQQAHKFSAHDYVRENIFADWLAGISLIELFYLGENRSEAVEIEIENHITSALIRCRQINLVELEPDILLAWARWNQICGNEQQALKDAEDALSIATRCKYRLKEADIYNFIAKYVLENEKNRVKAKEYAKLALDLAYCDGPPYYYKVAYDEAAQLIHRLTTSPLED